MTDLQKTLLIDLFAKNSIQNIDEKGQNDLLNIMDYENHELLLKDNDYTAYYKLLKAQKDKIENFQKDPDPVVQARNTIFYLYNKKEKEPNGKTFDVFMQLAKKCLLPQWPASLKEKFELARKYFLTSFHFFVSYTTRNHVETNKDFKTIIVDVYDEEFYEANKKLNNLVPSVIAKYLKGENLKTFFDQDILENGDKLKDEVSGYCASSFAFIQFVEKVMFREINEKDFNWTHYEYKEFRRNYDALVNSVNNEIYPSMYFFLSRPDQEDVYPVEFPPAYKEWREDIEERKVYDFTKAITKGEIKGKLIELAKRIKGKKEKALGIFLTNLN